MSRFLSRTLLLFNDCRLDCAYCGYDRGTQVGLDLEAIEQEARARADAGERTLVIASNDPVEHPQFDALAAIVLPLFDRVQIETTGLRLARELERAPWALSPKIAWSIPYVSADAGLHDRIVGRPGHHAVAEALLGDERLDVFAQVLLVQDVIADGNLGRTLARVRALRRTAALRAFTPRRRGRSDYYARSAPRTSELWSALVRDVEPELLREFVRINPQCLTPCSVPAPLQPDYLAAFRSALTTSAEALEDTSLDDLVTCPNAQACAFGDQCLGVHALYLERHGQAEFQPGQLDHSALTEHFAAMPSQALTAARHALEARRRGSRMVVHASAATETPAPTPVRPLLLVETSEEALSAEREVLAALRLPAAPKDDTPAVRRAALAAELAARIARDGADAVAADLQAFFEAGDDTLAHELRGHAAMDRASRLVSTLRFTEAASILAQLPEPRPRDFERVAHRVRVGLLLERGVRLLRTNKAEAIKTFRRVLELEPGQADAVRILAKHAPT